MFARSPPLTIITMPVLMRETYNSVLLLSNIIFLSAVVYETRHHTNIEGIAQGTGITLLRTFYVLLAFILMAVLFNTHGLVTACRRACGGVSTKTASVTKKTPPTPWERAHIYVSLFLANEFIFKILLTTGAPTAWHLTNAAGRTRLVYPLRYISWVTTNSYMFTAMSVAFGLHSQEILHTCLGVTVCMLSAFPLELLPFASPLWILVAIVSSFSLFCCLLLISRHAIALFPLATRTEAVALAVIVLTSCASYLSFPAIFFAAVICGGDGEGISCITNAEEANVWLVMESLAKVAIYFIIVVSSAIITNCTTAYAQQSLQALHRRTHSIPAKYNANAKEINSVSAWIDVLVSNCTILLVAPACTGVSVLLIEETLFSENALKYASAEVKAAIVTIQYATSTLAFLSSVSVFFIALDNVLRRRRMRMLISTLLPHRSERDNDDCDGKWSLESPIYNSLSIEYVEESHVTILFCDIVGFTPATIDVDAGAIMSTVSELFRHFDQLHANAGAVKVETSGDSYMSVVGTTTDVLTPSTQASKMATLALALIEASREHKWPNGAQIRIRVGIHCGAASSGVLGGALPRWGVFGHNVVIASRLESTGQASRVHVSSAFVTALREGGDSDAVNAAFVLTDRTVEVKGIGKMQTFWLSGREHEHSQ